MNRIHPRPLSPHLQIYRYTILMTMSIMHRLTGLALYAGMVIFMFWFLSLALGRHFYDCFEKVMHSFIGLGMLFGLSWCLFHHMLGGIRHLIWDSTRALDIPPARLLAWGNLILSLTLTTLIWMGGIYCHGI